MQTHAVAEADTDRTGRDVSGPSIQIETRRIHYAIGSLVALLLAGAASALILAYPLDAGDSRVGQTLWRLFALDGEGGFPAMFSFLLILAAALTIWVCTWTTEDDSSMSRYRWRWRVVAVVLTLIAFDEAVVIHEAISSALREELGLSGVLRRAWVLPYGLGALALAAMMITPLRKLPRGPGLLMLIGGCCYVLGAAGMEVAGAALPEPTTPLVLVEGAVVVEELLEIVGMWVFLGGGLRLLAKELGRIHLEIT